MNTELAYKVNIHLNHPKIVDTLKEYANERLDFLFKELEQTVDDRRMVQIQGSIQELRKLINIRDISIAVLEGNKRNGQKGD